MRRILCILAAAAAMVCGQDKQAAGLPSVELTVYLLTGSSAPGQTADDVPQDLAPTVKQLHGLFNYKSYKLTESFMLVGRSQSQAATGGILPGSPNYRYNFSYNNVRVSAETPHVIHVDRLTLSVRGKTVRSLDLKTESSDQIANLYTDLDIREGQKTVVGKSSVYSNGDALILVITSRVLE